MDTKTITQAELAEKTAKVLDQPVLHSAFTDFGDHFAAKITYNGTLSHSKLTALAEIGKVEVKRSGAGLSISLEIIK